MALQMTWQQKSRKSGPPLGLKNLGNSCYLNSVIQCLTYTPPLAQFCLSSQHSTLCKRVIVNRERECPFCLLERQIARSLSLDGPLDAPSKIQKCLALYAEHFRLGRQEDAHEFLRCVVDACHNACLKLLSRLSAARSDGAAGGGSVMREIFGGALLSQVKCLGCKGESNKIDEIMDISLDLFQTNSLKDALGRFFQPEVLDGNNKYHCDNCKKLCVARKQMFMERAPNVLVIQLKRFEGVHGGKINRNIEFEEGLMLAKYMCMGSQDPQPEYNLFGSIVHAGYSPESGHYYSYIKDAYGRWYCCNDAHVSLSSTQEVLSEKVYILFFIRCNQSPRSRKTGSPCKEVKVPDSNGIDASPRHKFADLVKPPITKPNGSISSKTNSSVILSNGKISSNPQIMPIVLKRVVGNGNGNYMGHNGASVEKSNNKFGQSPERKKSKMEQASSSRGDPKIKHDTEMPSSPRSYAANGSASSAAVEQNRNQTSSVASAHKSDNVVIVEMCDNNGDHNVAAVEGEAARSHTSSNVMNDDNPDNLGFKQKAIEAERVESLNMCGKESGCLSGNDVSQEVHVTCNGKSEELEKFKYVLAREASSALQSSGWVDSVHDFMRAKKRLCAHKPGRSHDNELKKQLISDARKTFLSQIPESLKGNLIERLRSFSQQKPLLDP